MSDGEDADVCTFCKHGKVIKRSEELAFQQWTRRGYIFCKVTIPIGTCDRCGTRSWSEDAEAVIEEAVRREFDQLP